MLNIGHEEKSTSGMGVGVPASVGENWLVYLSLTLSQINPLAQLHSPSLSPQPQPYPHTSSNTHNYMPLPTIIPTPTPSRSFFFMLYIPALNIQRADYSLCWTLLCWKFQVFLYTRGIYSYEAYMGIYSKFNVSWNCCCWITNKIELSYEM